MEFITLGESDRALIIHLVYAHGPVATARLLGVGETTLSAARDPHGALKASTAVRIRAALEDVRATSATVLP
jgi:hypothetical protein